MFRQATTDGGQVQFEGLQPGLYTIKVSAAGYEDSVQTVDVNAGIIIAQAQLRPNGEAAAAAQRPPGLPILSPKAQKLFAEVMKSLRENRLGDTRTALEKLYRLAPGHPDVNYLYGIYEAQANDQAQAISYWQKTLQLYPKHLGALLQLSQTALRASKPQEAVPFLQQALEVAPNSWRPHALMAQAFLEQRRFPETIKEAERALEFGHDDASSVQLVMARALVAQGNEQRAFDILREYLKVHPESVAAQKLRDSLQVPPPPKPPGQPSSPAPSDLPPLLPMAWKPPNVDDAVPPVERAIPCTLDDVLRQASSRVLELAEALDRFAATESLLHERIGASGLPYAGGAETESRKFEYLVSIGESQTGLLHVDEYRSGSDAMRGFPDDLVTLGLPGLAFVFHPVQAPNFDFNCEGLTHTSEGPSWQIHFQQKSDRIPTLQSYTEGGHTAPVALKGRAWISATSYQLVRLESDLVRPPLGVHLKTEHVVIEYGPVLFRQKSVTLWLPQSADIFFDWHDKRIHRHHSFSDFLLFSVDEKQKISRPKNAEVVAPDSPAASAPAKPD